MRPALEGRCIVVFRQVRRPKRRGDFRAEPEGELVGEEALVGTFQGPLKQVRLVTRHWLQV